MDNFTAWIVIFVLPSKNPLIKSVLIYMEGSETSETFVLMDLKCNVCLKTLYMEREGPDCGVGWAHVPCERFSLKTVEYLCKHNYKNQFVRNDKLNILNKNKNLMCI